MLFIADLHCSSKPSENKEVKERVKRIYSEFKDHLVVLGDNVDNGKALEFLELENILAPFYQHISIVKGNHDVGELGNFYSEQSVQYFNDTCARLGSTPTIIDGNLALHTSDTVLRTDSPLDFAQGKLSDSELLSIDMFLKNNSNRKTVIAMHHDPVNNNWFERLSNSTELFRRTYGIVDFMFSAHTHRTGGFVWTCSRGKPTKVVNVASLKYNKKGVCYRIDREGILTEVEC